MSLDGDRTSLPRWSVQLAAADGERHVEVEAATESEAARIAARSGGTPIAVKPVRQSGGGMLRRRGNASAVRLASELALLLRSGMALEPALSSLAKRSAKSPHGVLANALLNDVRGGKALHEAVRAREDMLPEPFAAICQAGEASGSLPSALGDLADFLEARQRFEQQVKGALIYPSILVVGSLIALIIILTVVIPRFETVFSSGTAAPPAFTQLVFDLANATSAALPYLGVGLLVAGLVGYQLSRQTSIKRRWNKWMLTAPVVGGFNRDALAARFTRLLALMLANGLSAAPALKLAAAATGDVYARERLNDAVDRVRTGSRFADELESAHVLPDMVVELLQVGEESGDLAGASRRLAEVYAVRVQRATQVTLQLIEPAIIVGIGLLIGGLMISILVALVSINDSAF